MLIVMDSLPLLDSTVRLDVNNVADSVVEDLSDHVSSLSSSLSCVHRSQPAGGQEEGENIPVLLEVGGQVDHTLLPEIPGEGVL